LTFYVQYFPLETAQTTANDDNGPTTDPMVIFCIW